MQVIHTDELYAWAFRLVIMLLIGAISFFLKRTASSLDKCHEQLAEMHKTTHPNLEKRISLAEQLLVQHDAKLEQYDLDRLVRRRMGEQEPRLQDLGKQDG